MRNILLTIFNKSVERASLHLLQCLASDGQLPTKDKQNIIRQTVNYPNKPGEPHSTYRVTVALVP